MIDRVAESLYRRWGRQYFDFVVACAGAIVCLFTVLHVACGVLYANASSGQFLRLLIAGELSMLVGAAVWIPMFRVRLNPIRLWIQGERTERVARESWRALAVTLPRAIGSAVGVTSVAAIPAEIYAPAVLHRPWWWSFPLFFVIAIAAACVAVQAFLFAEALLTPVSSEIAQSGYVTEDDQVRGVSIATKLLVLPPIVGFYTAGLAGAIGHDAAGPLIRIAYVLAGAGAISLTISLASTLLLRRSLLGPVDALVEASGRVGHGDLDIAVPALAEDELGALTHSFNRMVSDLRRQADELQRSRARVVAASDTARRTVERDLHDGAQQQLVLTQLKLAMLEPQPGQAGLITEIRGDLSRALAELRDLARGLYPPLLESEGLRGALTEAAARAAIPGAVECDGVGRYSPALEAAVYFCCLEALQNAAKHAGTGARAAVRLGERKGHLEFEVADDGRGFDAAESSPGAGLQNMVDRIGALGGELKIQSLPGQGTRVSGTVPMGAAPGEAT